MTAASSPRRSLTSSDSCGLSMVGVVRLVVTTGEPGSDMSTTRTPCPLDAPVTWNGGATGRIWLAS
jgi:hypothetical protein